MIRIEYFLADIKIGHMSIRYYYYKSGASSIMPFYTTFGGWSCFLFNPFPMTLVVLVLGSQTLHLQQLLFHWPNRRSRPFKSSNLKKPVCRTRPKIRRRYKEIKRKENKANSPPALQDYPLVPLSASSAHLPGP
jgi:hypothetical protein